MTAADSRSVWDQLDEVYPKPQRTASDPLWVQICVCGHPASAHPAEQGGTRAHLTAGMVTEGCVGPLRGRGKLFHPDEDGALVVIATCPCRTFRPVAELDRPRRSVFWSAMGARHPFAVAMQSFRTGQAKRKGMTSELVRAEVERRFRWLLGARVCAVCGTEADDVWPRYVNEVRESEMRCEEHG